MKKINAEVVRLKFRNMIYIPITKKNRSKKINDKNFTIISNNCWGGTVYESYNIKKLSPTVGMFIMPRDYIKFVKYFQDYINLEINFISVDKSKWRNNKVIKDIKKKYVIGVLGDIELHMLHYTDEIMAKDKWVSRVQRINHEKIIFKFNDQNGCAVEDIEDFLRIDVANKICFVSQKGFKINEEIVFIKNNDKPICASLEPFGSSRWFNLNNYINSLDKINIACENERL